MDGYEAVVAASALISPSDETLSWSFNLDPTVRHALLSRCIEHDLPFPETISSQLWLAKRNLERFRDEVGLVSMAAGDKQALWREYLRLRKEVRGLAEKNAKVKDLSRVVKAAMNERDMVESGRLVGEEGETGQG